MKFEELYEDIVEGKMNQKMFLQEIKEYAMEMKSMNMTGVDQMYEYAKNIAQHKDIVNYIKSMPNAGDDIEGIIVDELGIALKAL